jgi:hypothetical protein
MSRSCERRCLASPWSSDLAEHWRYGYTDFGEGRGRSPQPVLRAVVQASVPGAPRVWSALIDTGGPITVVRSELLDEGGDPLDIGRTMVLRLGGSSNEVSLFELTLEVRPPPPFRSDDPIAWRGLVAMLDPWPHQGTAIMLGQSGFLDTFAVTFGPDAFVLEPANVFEQRFPS